MVNKIKKYREVANILGNVADSFQLHQLMMRLENNSFIVPFFSKEQVQKSTFLNHFLKRDLLPEYREKTTKYVTYIFYAEQESVKVFDKADRSYTITFEQLRNIENLKIKDFEIHNIEIGITSPVLKQGLVLADMPYTKDFDRVEMLTDHLYPVCQYCVYILTNAADQDELEFMKLMERYDIQAIFTRTDIGTGIPVDVKDMVYKDTTFISNQKYNCKYFIVSDKTDKIKKINYKGDVYAFDDYIANKLGEGMHLLLEELVQGMVVEYREEFRQQLASKISVFQKMTTTDIDQLRKIIGYLNQEIDHMYFNAPMVNDDIKGTVKRSVSEIMDTVEELIQMEGREIEEIVRGTKNHAELNKKMELYRNNVVNEFVETINNLYFNSVKGMYREADSIYIEKLMALQKRIHDNVGIDYIISRFNVNRHEQKNHYFGRLLKKELMMIEYYLEHDDPMMKEHHVTRFDLIDFADYVKLAIEREAYDVQGIQGYESEVINSIEKALKVVRNMINGGIDFVYQETQAQILSRITKTMVGAKVSPLLAVATNKKDELYSIKNINPVLRISKNWYETDDTMFEVNVEVESNDAYAKERQRIEAEVKRKYDRIIEAEKSKMLKNAARTQSFMEKFQLDIEKRYAKKIEAEVEKGLKSIRVKTDAGEWQAYKDSYPRNCENKLREIAEEIHSANMKYYTQYLTEYVEKAESQYFSKLQDLENDFDEALEYRDRVSDRIEIMQKKAENLLNTL